MNYCGSTIGHCFIGRIDNCRSTIVNRRSTIPAKTRAPFTHHSFASPLSNSLRDPERRVPPTACSRQDNPLHKTAGSRRLHRWRLQRVRHSKDRRGRRIPPSVCPHHSSSRTATTKYSVSANQVTGIPLCCSYETETRRPIAFVISDATESSRTLK